MIFDFISYFEMIARTSIYFEHTDAKPHFGIASGLVEMEQLLQNLTRSDKFQLVVLSDQSGTFSGTSDSNLFDSPYHQFVVLKHNKSIDDMTQHNITLKECKLIGRKIIAKMRKDQMHTRSLPVAQDIYGLRHFDQPTINYFTVGPLGDGYFGIQFSFKTGHQETEKYDPDEWITQS